MERVLADCPSSQTYQPGLYHDKSRGSGIANTTGGRAGCTNSPNHNMTGCRCVYTGTCTWHSPMNGEVKNVLGVHMLLLPPPPLPSCLVHSTPGTPARANTAHVSLCLSHYTMWHICYLTVLCSAYTNNNHC